MNRAGTPAGLAIVGSTATGKTALAIEVARRLDGEIISVDSRQAYRGMEVGTAAPSPRDLSAAPHHGVGILEPQERYSAAEFGRRARSWIRQIAARDHLIILVGGTGLFLRALTDPVFREPETDPGRRGRLRAWLDEQPTDLLERWARGLDPALVERLGRIDRQRAGRTVELVLLHGRPLTWWQDHGRPEAAPVPLAVYALELEPEALRDRIERRAEALLDAGWIEETRRLMAAGLQDAHAFDAVGYRHVADLAAGTLERGKAVSRIVADTWAYARRQRTWFRHQLPEDTVRLDGRGTTDQLAGRLVADWRSRITGAGEVPES